MILKATNVIETLRTAFSASSYIHLSTETLEEVCRLLEGKAKRMSLQEVQDWLRTKESQRDPIFIQNTEDGSFFWLHEDSDVDDLDFCNWTMRGTWAAWTGRPTSEQMEEARKIG